MGGGRSACARVGQTRRMSPRFYVDQVLAAGASFDLPAGAARHVQVLRLQPGAAVRLFDGRGGEWQASVLRMGRREVGVAVGDRAPSPERELALPITLALGMPANERMDTLIEKATELGAVAVQPLVCERSVLRLSGERALKKVGHWQAVAQAASEQSGRTRVLEVAPVRSLADWLGGLPAAGAGRWLLAFDGARPIATLVPPATGVLTLSGPEGGFTSAEEQLARDAGFAAVSLGARVLRADTAPLAVAAYLAALQA